MRCNRRGERERGMQLLKANGRFLIIQQNDDESASRYEHFIAQALRNCCPHHVRPLPLQSTTWCTKELEWLLVVFRCKSSFLDFDPLIPKPDRWRVNELIGTVVTFAFVLLSILFVKKAMVMATISRWVHSLLLAPEWHHYPNSSSSWLFTNHNCCRVE
jgi:hypothetical protein